MLKDLNRTPAYKLLEIGDPWTFFDVPDKQLELSQVQLASGQPIVKWFDTSESARLFTVTAIHASKRIVETKYIGFQS